MRNLPDPPSAPFLSGRARRICSICCGTEREVTVDCPLDCEFLQEARQHEKPQRIDRRRIPQPGHPGHRKDAARPRGVAALSLRAALCDTAHASIPGRGRFRCPGGAGWPDPHLPHAAKRRAITRAAPDQSAGRRDLSARCRRRLTNTARHEQQQLGMTQNPRCRRAWRCWFSCSTSNSTATTAAAAAAPFCDALREFHPAGAGSRPPSASSLILP